MRLAASGLRVFVVLVAASGFVGCSSILGGFSTRPAEGDSGSNVDSSVEDSAGGDTGAPTDDGPSTSEAGGDAMSHDAGKDGASDAATCSMTTCGTSCVDTQTDPQNCGSCGNVCSALPHVMSATGITCSAGKCVIPPADCQVGYAHCTANAQDGCETTLSSPQSCGSCTTMCSGNTSLCQLDQTDAGPATYSCVSSCSGTTPDLCGSTCTNTQNDPQHCGTCANACTTVTGGGVASCAGGQCGVQCQTGEHQCGTTAVCAQDTDINNCGSMCVKCTAPTGGSVACSGGACAPSCPGTDQNCSGACKDTTSDPMNCSACGMTCSAPKTACSGSACVCPSTTPTYCSTPNTCVNTGSDPLNCGSCGHSCLGGTCSAGVCQPVTVYTKGTFEGAGGLYGISVSNTSPDQLLITNCAGSGNDALLEVTVSSPPAHLFSTAPTTNSYCGGAITGSFNTYYATSNGTATQGALWYTTWFNGAWGNPQELDNGTIGANIVSIQQAYTGIVNFTTNGSTNYICEMSVGVYNVAPTCTSLSAALIGSYGSKGVHGMDSDVNANLYVAAPEGAIIKVLPNSIGNQTAWLTAGVGAPYDIHIPGGSDTNLYWSDRTNGAIYRSPLTGPSATKLTASLSGGRIPVAEVPDGFMVDSGANAIYFWNLTSGNIWKIANNGTSSAMTNVAANSSGIGTVAQDATAVYWTVEGTTPTVMMLAK
jgi:hypothetical protein